MEKIKKILMYPVVWLAIFGMFAVMLIIHIIDLIFYQPIEKQMKKRSYSCPIDPHP